MNCGIAYTNLEKYELAETKFHKAISLLKGKNLSPLEANVQLNLGNCYRKQGKYDLAEKAFEIAEKFFRNQSNKVNLIHVLNYKAKLYKNAGDFEKTVKILEEIIEIRQENFSEKLSEKISDMKKKFESEQRERERKLLLEKNKELEKRNEELENAQQKIEKLGQRNAIYAMAVTTNHELNQPLTVIKTNLELLTTVVDTTNKKKMRYIKRLQNSLNKIDNILAKYRSQSGFRFTHYTDGTLMVTFED